MSMSERNKGLSGAVMSPGTSLSYGPSDVRENRNDPA